MSLCSLAIRKLLTVYSLPRKHRLGRFRSYGRKDRRNMPLACILAIFHRAKIDFLLCPEPEGIKRKTPSAVATNRWRIARKT